MDKKTYNCHKPDPYAQSLHFQSVHPSELFPKSVLKYPKEWAQNYCETYGIEAQSVNGFGDYFSLSLSTKGKSGT